MSAPHQKLASRWWLSVHLDHGYVVPTVVVARGFHAFEQRPCGWMLSACWLCFTFCVVVGEVPPCDCPQCRLLAQLGEGKET